MASNRLRTLASWHRVLGLASAVLVILLAVTGVLLHHAPRLGFDRQPIQSLPWLDWYGIAAPAEFHSYPAGGHRLSQLGNRVYLDAQELLSTEDTLKGAVRAGELIVLAGREHLWLLDARGALLETLGLEHGLPRGITQIGTHGTQLVLDTREGKFLADVEALRWRRTAGEVRQWAQAQAPPQALRSEIEQAWRARELTVERVLRDVHSGRILGTAGTFIMDVAAILLLVLTVTGIWVWRRARQEFGTGRRKRGRQDQDMAESRDKTAPGARLHPKNKRRARKPE